MHSYLENAFLIISSVKQHHSELKNSKFNLLFHNYNSKYIYYSSFILIVEKNIYFFNNIIRYFLKIYNTSFLNIIFLWIKNRNTKFCFKKSKDRVEIKICEEEEMNMHLFFANIRGINKEKKRLTKPINWLIMFNNKNFKSFLSQYYMLSRYWK